VLRTYLVYYNVTGPPQSLGNDSPRQRPTLTKLLPHAEA
jgi:hypothetical protein